jgi:hypothetical protein
MDPEACHAHVANVHGPTQLSQRLAFAPQPVQHHRDVVRRDVRVALPLSDLLEHRLGFGSPSGPGQCVTAQGRGKHAWANRGPTRDPGLQLAGDGAVPDHLVVPAQGRQRNRPHHVPLYEVGREIDHRIEMRERFAKWDNVLGLGRAGKLRLDETAIAL